MLKSFKSRVKTEKMIIKKNWKLLIAFLFCPFYCMFVPFKNMVFYLYEPVKNPQIKDFLHKLIPAYTEKYIHDIPQVLVWIVSIFLYIFIPLIISKCHANKIYSTKNFIVVCMLSNIMFFLRGFSFTITILPDPSPLCQNTITIDQPKNLFGNL